MSGLLYAHAKPKDPKIIPTFNEWYNTEHVPDVLKVPGMKAAARYTDETDKDQFLALYSMADVTKTDGLNSVRPTSELFGGQSQYAIADFDVRFMEIEKVFPADSGDVWNDTANPATLLVIHYLPSSPSALSNYEKKAQQLSKIKGWKRSVLVKTVGKQGAEFSPSSEYCGIHGFVGESEGKRSEIEGVIPSAGGDSGVSARYFGLLKMF